VPLKRITGRYWYDRFRPLVRDFFSWQGIAKQRKITDVWTEKMRVLHEKMGYEVRCRGSGDGELGNIDVTVFDEHHSEAQIAIELQQNKGDLVKRDMPKLACSNARLKILMTRVRENEIENFKDLVLNLWRKKSKRTWKDELLLLFVVEEPSGPNEVTFRRIEPYLSKTAKTGSSSSREFSKLFFFLIMHMRISIILCLSK